MLGIHQMSREGFAEEKSTAYPHGMNPEIIDTYCAFELSIWRRAVVYHYFLSTGEHRPIGYEVDCDGCPRSASLEQRGLTNRMKIRPQLELAFDALRAAYQASIEVVMPCAA